MSDSGTENSTNKTSELVGGIIGILLIVGCFKMCFGDDSCNRDGCENKGIGWEHSTSGVDLNYNNMTCYGCCRERDANDGGYCSKACCAADQ